MSSANYDDFMLRDLARAKAQHERFLFSDTPQGLKSRSF